MHTNKLTLKLLKTEFIVIGSKPKLSNIDETTSIFIAGEEMYRFPMLSHLVASWTKIIRLQRSYSGCDKKAGSGLSILRYTG